MRTPRHLTALLAFCLLPGLSVACSKAPGSLTDGGSGGASSTGISGGATSGSSGGSGSNSGGSTGASGGVAITSCWATPYCVPPQYPCSIGGKSCCAGLVCAGTCKPTGGQESCTCPACNETCCGGPHCSFLGTDTANCGECGVVCDGGSICQNGSCTSAPCFLPDAGASCGAGLSCCGASCCGPGQVCCLMPGSDAGYGCSDIDAGGCPLPGGQGS